MLLEPTTKYIQIEQVTKPSAHKSPSVLRRLRNIALAAGIVTGAGTAGALVLNEMTKPTRETYLTHHA